jgi:hypothetical protein
VAAVDSARSRAGDLPMPVAQCDVRDRGGLVARVDFGWVAQRLAVEYAGMWHVGPGQFRPDRQRLNRLTGGWVAVLFVTGADLHQPARLIDRVRAALQ